MEQEPLRDIRQARRGNKEAFVRLIRMNETSLYRVARAILHSDGECADAIQEAILKAYKSIGNLKKPQYFKTWLIRILINECHRIQAHRQKVIPLDTIRERSYQESGFEALELLEAINQLDDDLRTTINLYYQCDLSVSMISEALQIPEGTVKSRLFRAREQLAVIMDETSSGGEKRG